MASPHTLHEWRERADDGEHRYYRAWRGLGKWHFLTTLKSDPDWQPLDNPDADFLASLREKLFAKYQRRRVPWEQIAEIDKMLEDLAKEESEVPQDGEESDGWDEEDFQDDAEDETSRDDDGSSRPHGGT